MNGPGAFAAGDEVIVHAPKPLSIEEAESLIRHIAAMISVARRHRRAPYEAAKEAWLKSVTSGPPPSPESAMREQVAEFVADLPAPFPGRVLP